MEVIRRLAGRHVVITGAASGIGLAIANRCAAEGAKIAICDRDAGRLAEVQADRPDWICQETDVASEAGLAAFFDRICQSWPHIDCLINNAGIAGPTAPMMQVSDDEWQRVIDVNLMSGIRGTRLAVPMINPKGGSVIFMSSIAGRVAVPERTPYVATKWALIGLMKSLSFELGAQKIRVNAILPGLTSGERLDGVVRARAASAGRSFEDQMAYECRSTAIGEACCADDIAAAAAFLASDDSLRMTGVALPVDGGLESIIIR